MAISRLQASLAQATNEVTVAAANINFDFTLIKCEAPKEYHPLGNSLSRWRKTEAESGRVHATARRLGALFEGVCPPTPKLIAAYGLRASEIAAKTEERKSDITNVIFAEQTGIDGLSIWAAATSSEAAIHVQLLACMLARVFDAQRATSIWYELVKDRKYDIASRFEEGERLRFASLTAAAQVDVSRADLSTWDASARAWLRTADGVMNKEQQQLMLIVANTSIPVSNDMSVYTSVLPAWNSALQAMEHIMNGRPQAVNIGPPLLALSAWHLYPDLLVLGETEVHVEFHDKLVSESGKLTIGLELDSNEARGIFWSLSLKHLKFYGLPVDSTGTHNNNARLTFPQFRVVILGVIAGVWELTDVDELASFFIITEGIILKAATDARPEDRVLLDEFRQYTSHPWRILAAAARTLQSEDPAVRDEAKRLIALGQRGCRAFMPAARRLPCFGLLESHFGYNDDPEDEALNTAQLQRLMIRTVDRSNSPTYHTALPQPSTGHHKWVDLTSPKTIDHHTALPRRLTSLHKWLGLRSPKTIDLDTLWKARANHPAATFDCVDAETGARYELKPLFGDSASSLLCQPVQPPEIVLPGLTIAHLLQALQEGYLTPASLLHYLESFSVEDDQLITTINILSLVATLYEDLPQATLHVGILTKPLAKTAWAQALLNGMSFLVFMGRRKMNLAMGFSCIAYMEECVDISLRMCKSVFALAHGDSLYLARQLTCDPALNTEGALIRHMLGNVGRPGITLLIPPSEPMVRPADLSSWRINTNNIFNGLPENHFASTSLHLSFTEYYVPLHQASQRTQDSQAFFLESIISVHDAGKWVADIDILPGPRHNRRRVRQARSCAHNRTSSVNLTNKTYGTLMSAETWADILDLPANAFVVRAHGDWSARLAVTAVLEQLAPSGDQVIICPPDFCWHCEHAHIKTAQDSDSTPTLPRRYVY
ncbi:hypothetical protein AMS68_003635 [Peltaster fructicola]|uniref:Uncharacterized protein n=1 Tax=Peltaster fructicola TaxID=286661 RepID=A0A6H0XU28_9PEZI|nr:hypothetical protein AMS68_003635 [Peltaster fructicola]